MASLLPHIPVPLGLSYLRKTSGVKTLIINYHMVSDQDLSYIKNLYHYRDISGFIADLAFYQKHYQLIDLKQFLDHHKSGGAQLPDNALLITFDDGFREIYEIVAPLLKEREIPATFFINRDFVDNHSLNHDNKQSLLAQRLNEPLSSALEEEIRALAGDSITAGHNLSDWILGRSYQERSLLDKLASVLKIDFKEFLAEKRPYMTREQIRDLLNMGFTIGGHSLDHARFSELTMDEQIHQARASIDYLVDEFSLDYRVFAFPYSDRGTTGDFFRIFSKEVDASFGTHGLLNDPVINHFQRISVEKYRQAARRTIKFHYSRRAIYNLLGKNNISRNEH